LSGIVIEFYGGAATRVGVGDTAFAQRQAEYNIINYGTVDRHGRKRPTHRLGPRLWDALKPYSSGGQVLTLTSDLGEEATGRVWQQLRTAVELKTKYDPTNFFSLNQNIKPRAGSSADNIATRPSPPQEIPIMISSSHNHGESSPVGGREGLRGALERGAIRPHAPPRFYADWIKPSSLVAKWIGVSCIG